MPKPIENRKYKLVDYSTNTDKFWNITLFDNGDCHVEWGRNGTVGQQKFHEDVGRDFFVEKTQEKERKGYQLAVDFDMGKIQKLPDQIKEQQRKEQIDRKLATYNGNGKSKRKLPTYNGRTYKYVSRTFGATEPEIKPIKIRAVAEERVRRQIELD
jgi:predicted DNA-binding WGR domain protein